MIHSKNTGLETKKHRRGMKLNLKRFMKILEMKYLNLGYNID